MLIIRDLIVAHLFLLMPVSKGDDMPVGGFKQPAKDRIDGVESIIGNTNSKC